MSFINEMADPGDHGRPKQPTGILLAQRPRSDRQVMILNDPSSLKQNLKKEKRRRLQGEGETMKMEHHAYIQLR